MKKENTVNEPTTPMAYDALLCPVGLFRYFIRKQYDGIEISNKECDGIRIEFAKYLHELNLTDKQKENILPKSEIDVIMNAEHPLRMHGFPAAYVFHFALLKKRNKKRWQKVTTPMGHNVLQLTEVGDYEAQNFKLIRMLNRRTNAHITTKPPIFG